MISDTEVTNGHESFSGSRAIGGSAGLSDAGYGRCMFCHAVFHWFMDAMTHRCPNIVWRSQ